MSGAIRQTLKTPAANGAKPTSINTVPPTCPRIIQPQMIIANPATTRIHLPDVDAIKQANPFTRSGMIHTPVQVEYVVLQTALRLGVGLKHAAMTRMSVGSARSSHQNIAKWTVDYRLLRDNVVVHNL